ncbi:MAG TPA: hypothetical protein VFG45_11775 [Candidatus Nitrosocosmicus sp.]|nr:hypothetical protein [Candidatus Nitrosocosmicus sp.]
MNRYIILSPFSKQGIEKIKEQIDELGFSNEQQTKVFNILLAIEMEIM